MRVCGSWLLAYVVTIAVSTTARAQEPSRFGVTMGYPASIGVLWHVADRVALRPEFSFAQTDSSSESIVNDESHFWSLGTGVSVLFYSSVTDNLRTYVTPRFSYTRTNGDSTTTTSTTDIYSFGGMFGAQYALGRRFAAFGEVGVNYSRQYGSVVSSIPSLINRISSHGDAFGTRTGVGVILYF